MKKVLCSIPPILTIALLLAMVSGAAFAQAPATGEDTAEYFTTNYFSNNTAAGAPDGTLRYTMHYGAVLQERTLCANIYVFAADQQPTECCSCKITANGLVTASVKKNLTSNPLTGNIPADGVVQIVSSLPVGGVCDPTFGFDGTPPTAPYPEVDSWMTHIQNNVGTAFPITETSGLEELLTSEELTDLAYDCAFALEFGSGGAVCTCGTEK
ncbi:MAG: hypothetical protein ACRD2U_02680 [Terriglobales bacterium]